MDNNRSYWDIDFIEQQPLTLGFVQVERNSNEHFCKWNVCASKSTSSLSAKTVRPHLV